VAADLTRFEYDAETKSLVLGVGALTAHVPFAPQPSQYRGVWKEGAVYVPGDTVTWGGSMWITDKPTEERPGAGKTAWQLCVKAGRDGKTGAPGPVGPMGPRGEKGDARWS
jgi:hypothetical protein